jgi:hypothetical protein
MSHADLIAEAREYLSRDLTEKSVDFIRRVLAALESQPAPLVADSREALAEAIQDAILEWAGEEDAPTFGFIVDHVLASGVVSVAADRDRALKADAWDEGRAATWTKNDDGSYLITFGEKPNPYRESEGK